MARVNYRWPVAECLHENTQAARLLTDGHGQIVRTYPERCYDCGAKRTGGEWK